jgi:hypothetical protein
MTATAENPVDLVDRLSSDDVVELYSPEVVADPPLP